jgi:riboflavin biosynthesis pyrimidine reductase
MGAPESPPPDAGSEQALRLRPLMPAGEPASVAEAVEAMGLWDRPSAPPSRPRTLLNMVATVDGRATLGGRSGPISDAADHALFHGLRAAVDGVLVGAGTLRVEHYGRLVREQGTRRLRAERGLAEEPLACIVSGRLALGPDIPLLRAPDARVAILTSSQASLPECEARVDYVRAADASGRLDLAAGMAMLARDHAVHMLLCEGGPHLARELLSAGLLDELFLTVSPRLAGGEPAGGEALRILAGAELEPTVELELLGVLGSGSSLFLRYGVSARDRVSRETIESSSLAR